MCMCVHVARVLVDVGVRACRCEHVEVRVCACVLHVARVLAYVCAREHMHVSVLGNEICDFGFVPGLRKGEVSLSPGGIL